MGYIGLQRRNKVHLSRTLLLLSVARLARLTYHSLIVYWTHFNYFTMVIITKPRNSASTFTYTIVLWLSHQLVAPNVSLVPHTTVVVLHTTKFMAKSTIISDLCNQSTVPFLSLVSYMSMTTMTLWLFGMDQIHSAILIQWRHCRVCSRNAILMLMFICRQTDSCKKLIWLSIAFNWTFARVQIITGTIPRTAGTSMGCCRTLPSHMGSRTSKATLIGAIQRCCWCPSQRNRPCFNQEKGCPPC